jgi:anthranilate synthase component 1
VKRLEYAEFESLAQQGNVIPVYATFLADLLTPVSAFLRLQRASTKAFLFESVEGGEKTARYSFLGCDPYQTIRASDDSLLVEGNGTVETVKADVFEYLKEKFKANKVVHPKGLPRFTGGAVGFFGYETIKRIEDIPTHENKDLDIHEAILMLFDTIMAFDHLSHEIYICSNVFIEKDDDPASKYSSAMQRIADFQEILSEDIHIQVKPAAQSGPVSSNFSRDAFCQAVEVCKDYIRAGDIFQVVLSQRFSKQIGIDPFTIYRALRIINPSPYLYFLKVDDFSIIGSSPELLVRIEDGICEVRPIAGTRPRGTSETEDEAYVEELKADEKEIAEHIMLVDLGRNDVGRVSEFGSVAVTEFMAVEKYSHVMHLVSNVSGKLQKGYDAIDAFKACFPAGTVSGAPKIRAMEIITELEKCQRGVYAGALGYLDFSGNLDTCIAIRTILVKGDQAYFQAGAGIVADSVPENEYQETVNKASALKAAIEFAERGLE